MKPGTMEPGTNLRNDRNIRNFRNLALVCLAVSFPTVLSATDWPHWRGPSATGVAAPSPLPATWSARDNVAWQAPLAGAGVSSPIVHGDRVFVTSQIGDGRRRDGRHPTLTQGADPSTAGEATLSRRSRAQVGFIVEAFDRSTGKRLWIHEMAAEGELPPVHDKHNLSSASPVTDGERVYAWYGTGQLVALDMTGKPAWSKNLAKEYARSTFSGATPVRRRCSRTA